MHCLVDMTEDSRADRDPLPQSNLPPSHLPPPELARQIPAVLRKLRIRDLETLRWLGRTRSFARTAEAAAITQPALSKWLREIEDALGVSLFERTTRRVTPTPYGDALLERAERMLTDLAGVAPAMQALRDGLARPVNVGVLPGMASVLMPQTLAQLERTGPTLRINLFEDTLDRLLPRAHWHEIDLLVCRLDETAMNAGFGTVPLYEDDVRVFGARNHPLASHPSPGWPDVARYPWIVPPPGTPMRRAIDTEFAHHGLPLPRVVMESVTLMTNASTAQVMPCLFLASTLGVARSPLAPTLHDFGLPFSHVAPTVGVLHGHAPSAATLALIDVLQDVSRTLTASSS
ncbi:HTH-type transcriptional regulator GbpR [Pandoraea sputorum]|nr:HTH-type transcriptional regulator GbpR [Pandoraea sputorum]